MSDQQADPQKPTTERAKLYATFSAFLAGQIDLQKEQKRELKLKQWRWYAIIGVFIAYFGWIISYGAYQHYGVRSKEHVALVRLEGPIMPGAGFSYLLSSRAINTAFDDKTAKAVALVINSPGGAPAQSQMIYDLILKRKAETGRKVYVFGEDTMASGAYLVAMAGDKVCAPTTSIVGSIGVVMEGYDLTGVYDKWGVKSRTFTAGDNKRRLDPFAPVTDEDRKKVEETLSEVHADFINIVKTGRGAKIDTARKDLFSGDVWTGGHALKLGLLDCTENMSSVLKADFGTDVTIEYVPQLNYGDIVRALSKN